VKAHLFSLHVADQVRVEEVPRPSQPARTHELGVAIDDFQGPLAATENAASRRVMEKLGMAHDADDDFEHSRLPEGHPLRRHVLYHKRSFR
jgi:hypothetical protein